MLDFKPFILTVLAVGVVATRAKTDFEVQEDFAGKVCPADSRVFENQASSALACAVMAAEKTVCRGLSYHHDSNMCYGCDTFVDATGLQPLPGAVFYRKLNANDGFINVSGYMLKIVNEEKVPYDTAESACAEVGQLVRIATPDKQLAIRSFLQSSGIKGISYWIQGRKDSDGIWKFDDGTPTPMSRTYWAPGEPKGHSCCSASEELNLVGQGYGDACTVGHYCPNEKTETPVDRPSGTFLNETGAQDCRLCSAGYYGDDIQLTAPRGECTAGYYCTLRANTSSPTDGTTGDTCPAGNYCPVGSIAPTQCVDGTYANDTGMVIYTNDPGMAIYTTCPAGNYCPIGSIAPTTCADGTYANDTGMVIYTMCPARFY